MDIKEIAKKVVEGGNADELVKGLDEKQQSDFWIEVKSQRKLQADDELRVIEARRKERQSIESDIEKTKSTAESSVRSQMRSEQIDIAFNLADREFTSNGITLTPEEKTKLKEDFKKHDSGKFDATLIVSDILTAYGATNAEKLIKLKSQSSTFEAAAAAFNAGGASGGNPGGGGDPGKQYDPRVLEYVREAGKQGINMTPEQVERGLKAGQGWKKMTVDTSKPPRI